MEEENKVEEKSEEKVEEAQAEGTVIQDKAKQWLQDNLRIIISVLIVVAIAGGIYSYSKRTEAPVVSDQEQTVQQSADNSDNSAAATTDNATNNSNQQAAPAGTSQETEKSFVETASKGDSYTSLARRALANYLEKNQDSSLTAEHKIYIEDFLRKNVPNQKRMFAGTSVEFSKSLIQNAITKAKSLNARQLHNLHKYAVMVPSLS